MLPDRVIRHGRVEAERWTFVGVDGTEVPEPLPAGAIVVPLATWQSRREALAGRATPVGVWLSPADEPGVLVPDFGALSFIAVHFPKFADGRGFSTATLLRRAGWHGELRAFGDVARDQLFSLKRVGFDSFALPPHRDPKAALAAFGTYKLPYQGSIDDPVPLFRKRLAGGDAR